MGNSVRRLIWIVLLSGAGYAGWLTWQSRRDDAGGEDDDSPSWPPLDAPAAPVDASVDALATESDEIAAAIPTADDARWVDPVDGGCPDGFPVKANDNSGIYHVPGGRFYDRTVPERCYADTEAAEADGYRAAKA